MPIQSKIRRRLSIDGRAGFVPRENDDDIDLVQDDK